jgi:hypothetical protein
MSYKEIKVGKPLSLDDIIRKPAPRKRESPRDVELVKLVREVAVGPESQVLPWVYGETKPATARLAANKAVKTAELDGAVFVSARADFPGVLLFSRQPLSNRGRKQAQGHDA